MNENISSETDNSWPYRGSKLVPKEELKPFLKRNNINGVIHLFLHLSLIFLSGLIIFFSPNIYIKILAMIAHGTFISFLSAFHPLHFGGRCFSLYIYFGQQGKLLRHCRGPFWPFS